MSRSGYHYYQNLRSRFAFWIVAGLCFLFALARASRSFSWDVTVESVLWSLHRLRFQIAIALFALLSLSLLFHRKRSESSSTTHAGQNSDGPKPVADDAQSFNSEPSYRSLEEYVLYLEHLRKERGYKPGWLYFRCKALNLVDVLEELRAAGKVPRHTVRERQASHDRFTGSKRPDAFNEAKEDSADPYEILGVPKTASHDDIKRAYRDAVKQYHPDRVQTLGPRLQEVAKKMTVEINRAYEVLTKDHTERIRRAS